MNAIKIRRGYWTVKGPAGDHYATLALVSDFAGGSWEHGWHVYIRGTDGAILSKGSCHRTRQDAEKEACLLLNN